MKNIMKSRKIRLLIVLVVPSAVIYLSWFLGDFMVRGAVSYTGGMPFEGKLLLGFSMLIVGLFGLAVGGAIIGGLTLAVINIYKWVVMK